LKGKHIEIEWERFYSHITFPFRQKWCVWCP